MKKFGMMRLPVLAKTSLKIILIFGIIYLATGIILKDYSYLTMFIIQSGIAVFSVYSMMKKNYVKAFAEQSFSKTDMQIVFFDDYFELTTPYSKSVYYYNEIIHAEEKAGGITLIVDTCTAPVSIFSGSIKLGSYMIAREILAQKLQQRFIISAGGAV